MYNLITQHVKEHINFIFCPVYKIMDIKKPELQLAIRVLNILLSLMLK